MADYQQFEDDLIRAGTDTDDAANYASFYAAHSRTLATADYFWSDFWRLHQYQLLEGGVCYGFPAVAAGLVILRWRRHRRRIRSAGRYDPRPA